MFIKIEGQEYKIPASLFEITLSDRIAYDQTHGKEMREKLQQIIELPEGYERDMGLVEYQCDLAAKTLSFFGKIPMKIIMQTKVEDVLLIYHHSMKSLSEENDYKEDFELIQNFEWDGELWEIAPPELKHNSEMLFSEFLDAKQWVKNLFELGNERWEALLMLCCIYFRKKGEGYSKELADEGGPRYKLLQQLPFEYALHVGFFLSASMSSFLQRFHYSGQTAEVDQQNYNATLISGNG